MVAHVMIILASSITIPPLSTDRPPTDKIMELFVTLTFETLSAVATHTLITCAMFHWNLFTKRRDRC